MQVIMIAGKAGSGKTTLAKILAKHVYNHGLVPILASFAGPLKEEAKEKGYDKELFPEKYREFCQKLGASAREGNPDHWVDLMRERMKSVKEEEAESIEGKSKFWERCVIIDDCRYLNEINLGIEMNASILFLTTGRRGLKEHDWRSHESESLANDVEEGNKELIDLFDHIIFNDRDERYLDDRIQDMVPVWCGMSANPEKEGSLLCNCKNCREERLFGLTPKQQAIEDFLDMLGMFEEEDDDEETY